MNQRAESIDRAIADLAYLPFFLVLFIGVQFGGNITRRLNTTGHEKRDMVRDIVVNSLVSGLFITIMFFINMYCHSQQIYVNLFDGISTYYLYNYMLIVCLAQMINTVLYRKSGTIWPGVAVCTLFFGVLLPGGFPLT